MYDFDFEPGDIAQLRGEPPLISALVFVSGKPDHKGAVEILRTDGERETVASEALSMPGINWTPDDIAAARTLCEAFVEDGFEDDDDREPSQHHQQVQHAAMAMEISCRLYRKNNPGFRLEGPDTDHEHVKAILVLAAKLEAAVESALAAGCDPGVVAATCALARICDYDLKAA